MAPKTYTTSEVSEITGVNRRTLQYWIVTGRLAAEKQLGRGRGRFLITHTELARLRKLLLRHGRNKIIAALTAAVVAAALVLPTTLPDIASAQTYDGLEKRFGAIERRLDTLEAAPAPGPAPTPAPVPGPTPTPVPAAAGVEVRGGDLYLAGQRWYMDGLNQVAPWGTAADSDYGDTPQRELRRALVAKNATVGSKAARIIMWANAGGFPGQNTYEWRAGVVKAAIDSGQIPIVGMWDNTCSRTPGSIPAVEAFWISGDGKRLAQQFPQLVINPFNEMNFAKADAGGKLTGEDWRDYYIGLVKRIRDVGLKNAVMIDAGGQCAQNPEGIIKYGAAMQAADPEHRLIFAIHMYAFWVDGAPQRWPNGQWQIAPLMKTLGELPVPVVLAEFGDRNNQDGSNYDVVALLAAIKTHKVDGALPWMDLDQMPGKPFYSVWEDLTGRVLTPYGQKITTWLKAGR